jgi:hypothetical protein
MSKEQELIVEDTLEGRGTGINVKYRVRYDYQPAERATRFEPGCDEEFTINAVAMQLRAGTWIDLDSSEYDDAAMVEHITEAREQARADAALDDYLSRMVA